MFFTFTFFYISHFLKLLLTHQLLVHSIITNKRNIILTTESSLLQVLQMPEVLITVESEISNECIMHAFHSMSFKDQI